MRHGAIKCETSSVTTVATPNTVSASTATNVELGLLTLETVNAMGGSLRVKCQIIFKVEQHNSVICQIYTLYKYIN